MLNDIPKIDYHILCDENHLNNKLELEKLKIAVTHYGFLIIKNYPNSIKNIINIFSLYKQFFYQSFEEKNKVNMANTSSNRGWGELKAEQVNKDYNLYHYWPFDSNRAIADVPPSHNYRLSACLETVLINAHFQPMHQELKTDIHF